jgi:outer membrane receptor protein involved in Fe transport
VGGYLVFSSATYSDFCSIQAPQYRYAPGGAQGMGEHVIPILSPNNGDDVLSDCGIVDGNDVPRNSDVTANVDISATLPNTIFGLTTQFRADIRYQSEYYLDHMNLMEMPSLTTLNLSAIMRNEHLNIRLYANNITDEDDPANVSMGSYYSPNADPSQAAIRAGSWTLVPRRPREIGVIASYSF